MPIYTRESLQTDRLPWVEVDDFEFFHLGRIMVMNNHSVGAPRGRLRVRTGAITRTGRCRSRDASSRRAPRTASS